ncbi:MAG: hypothetical protein JW769_03705 [Parachlamydiales bacterium]|nr:hypothetical protein [Parachlamydiales bacterium]
MAIPTFDRNYFVNLSEARNLLHNLQEEDCKVNGWGSRVVTIRDNAGNSLERKLDFLVKEFLEAMKILHEPTDGWTLQQRLDGIDIRNKLSDWYAMTDTKGGFLARIFKFLRELFSGWRSKIERTQDFELFTENQLSLVFSQEPVRKFEETREAFASSKAFLTARERYYREDRFRNLFTVESGKGEREPFLKVYPKHMRKPSPTE